MLTLSAEAKRYLTGAPRMEPMIDDAYETSVAKVIRPWAEMNEATLGIVGIPFDTTTIFRRGSRYGPSAVRDALQSCTTYEPSLDVDIAEGNNIADFGNVDVLQTQVEESWRRIEVVMTSILATGVTPIVVGGDHGNTYPAVRALSNVVRGRIGIILVDAHFDVRISHHGEVSSGVPFRYIVERLEGHRVRGRNLVEIGVTGWHNAKLYRDWCREQEITVIPAREVHRRSIDEIVSRALDVASEGTDALWISLDIDALDAAYAPGTNAPTIGGLTTPQVLEMVYQFGLHPKVRGYDVMEVSPWLDTHAMTVHLAAATILNFIAARQVVEAAGDAASRGTAPN